MTRIVPVIVLVVSLVTSRGARAQTTTGMLGNNANIVFKQRAIFDESKGFVQQEAGTPELFRYFNRAHCNCARAAFNADQDKTTGTFNYLVQLTQQTSSTGSADYYAGTGCDQPANRPGGSAPTCSRLIGKKSAGPLSVSSLTNLYPGGTVTNFNLYEVVNTTKADGTTACLQSDSVSNAIYALVDTTGPGNTNYNYSSSIVAGKLDGEAAGGSGVDTRPPPLPANPVALSGEGEIDLKWDSPSTNNTDTVAYQALCAINGSHALATPSNSARYVTTVATCGMSNIRTDADMERPTKTQLDNSGTPVDPVTNINAFGLLDASFICGENPSGTATSLTISNLQNGVAYQVILVAVDLHGNFAATYFDHTITPVPVTDFWEVLHDRGSQADGGLCLLAETYGDDNGLTQALRAFRDETLGHSPAGRWLSNVYYSTLGQLGSIVRGSIILRILAGVLLAPVVGFALLWHWLTLPGALGLFMLLWWLRRRWSMIARRGVRRGRVIPGLTAGALILLGGGLAHAGGYQPYWDDAEQLDRAKAEAPLDDPSLVTWHAGLRLGPFIPDIDSQVSVSPAPYKQMFGGYHMLTMLDVHRIVWTGFGQVGVGGSIGYWQKTARPFIQNANLDDPNPQRQPGNKNAFRIVPTELTATYRLTVLDDDYGVPIVPYVRGGLAYYIWWMTAPSGNLSRVCDSTGTMCGSKALGASLGVTGAIGLAIRAERVDAAAAMSMRQSGIQHAGVYAELSLAKVDGFGSDKKLSVGDRTWFAGVDFEF